MQDQDPRDKFHPAGWIALFEALNRPCECEQIGRLALTHKELLKRTRACRDNPLPHPGFRWYRNVVVRESCTAPARLTYLHRSLASSGLAA